MPYDAEAKDDPPKKGKGLLLLLGKGKDGGDDDDSDADTESMAADDLMDALGVPDDKRDDAKRSLQNYVEACIAKAMKE